MLSFIAEELSRREDTDARAPRPSDLQRRSRGERRVSAAADERGGAVPPGAGGADQSRASQELLFKERRAREAPYALQEGLNAFRGCL